MNKRIITLCFLICLTLCQIPIPASAEDMRVVGQHTRSKKAALLKQVQTEKSEAETEALLTSRQIGRDRRALILDIQKLEKDNRTIRASNERQRIELKQLQEE